MPDHGGVLVSEHVQILAPDTSRAILRRAVVVPHVAVPVVALRLWGGLRSRGQVGAVRVGRVDRAAGPEVCLVQVNAVGAEPFPVAGEPLFELPLEFLL